MVLCGGSESMSQAPYAVRNIRFGTKFGFDLKVGFWFISTFLSNYINEGCTIKLIDHIY